MAEYPEFDKYVNGLIELELRKYKVRIESAYVLNKEIIDYFEAIRKLFSQLMANDISGESVEMMEQQLKDFLPALSQLKLLTSVQCPEMMPQHNKEYVKIKNYVIKAMPVIEAKNMLNQLNVILSNNEIDLKKEKDRLKYEAKKEEDRKKRAERKAEEQTKKEVEEQVQKQRDEKRNEAELERSMILADINCRIEILKSTRTKWILISIFLSFTIFGLISGIQVIRQINRDIAALENERRAVNHANMDTLLSGYRYQFSDKKRGGITEFNYSGYFSFFISQLSLYKLIVYEEPDWINKWSNLKMICIICQFVVFFILYVIFLRIRI